MSKSSDPRHFFESDAQQAKRERRDAKSSNKYGSPVALKSKILAAIADPRSATPPAIFVAESAGSVRHVKLGDEPDTKTVYRGPPAPVTCIAVGGPGGGIIFAGSWDKSIWSWDLSTGQQGRKYTGHTDFVKTVVCAKLSSSDSSSRDVLISAGADKRIIVWDIATGKELHVLQDGVTKMLAVQHLAVDPVRTTPGEIHLVSASSDPHVRRWRIRETSWEQVVDEVPDPAAPTGAALVTERRTLLEHETSVYRVVFAPDADGESADLWTASGDGTAKCLSPQQNLAPTDVFNHGDHVKALAVSGTLAVTAGRDEDLKFWDRASGELYCVLEGHYDEVTDLLVLVDGRLCSVSIDGTVRTWPMQKPQLDALVTEQREAAEGKVAEPEAAAAPQEGVLSAEEEAELAALMDDD